MTISIEPSVVTPISEARSRVNSTKVDSAPLDSSSALLGNYKRAPGRFTRGEGASMMQESRFIGEIPKELLEEWRLQMGYSNPYASNDPAAPF